MTAKDKQLVIPAGDLETQLDCQAELIRDYLRDAESTSATQPIMATLMSGLAGLYRICVNNNYYPSGMYDEVQLGALMKAVFGFLRQPSDYNGISSVKSLLMLYPEWQKLTSTTAEDVIAEQRLSRALNSLRANPIPAPGA